MFLLDWLICLLVWLGLGWVAWFVMFFVSFGLVRLFCFGVCVCVFDCLVSFGLIWVNCLCCFVVFVWFDCSSVGCFFLGLLVWLGLVWGDCFVFLLVLFRSSLVWFVCFVWTWLLVLFGCCVWLHRSPATKNIPRIWPAYSPPEGGGC